MLKRIPKFIWKFIWLILNFEFCILYCILVNIVDKNNRVNRWVVGGSRYVLPPKIIGGIYDLGQLYKQKQAKCYKKIWLESPPPNVMYIGICLYETSEYTSATSINNIYWFIDTMIYMYHGFMLMSSGINLITRCDIIFSLENIFDPVWTSEFRLCLIHLSES